MKKDNIIIILLCLILANVSTGWTVIMWLIIASILGLIYIINDIINVILIIKARRKLRKHFKNEAIKNINI